MDSRPVICLGEILTDLLADQRNQSIEEVNSWTAYPGGAPANVACGLVKLGTPSAFIGCVGRDKTGLELIGLLNRLGVDTTGVQYHPTAPTRQVYVTRDSDGERHFAGFGTIPTTDFADTALISENLPESLFSQASYLVMGTLGLAYPHSRQSMIQALEFARRYKVKVFIDVNWRPVFWTDIDIAPSMILEILQRADLMKCSDEEAFWLFGTDNIQEIKQQLPHLQGILVTAGERGCQYSLGDHSGNLGAFSVSSIDTTGAGDGFAAGFLHQCCQLGEAIFQDSRIARQAITYANAVGAMVTMKAGAIDSQPTNLEVEDFLQRDL